MKKLKSLLPVLGAAVVLFSGCDFLNLFEFEDEVQKKTTVEKKDVTEKTDTYYFHTIQDSEDSIKFDDSLNGKDLYIIYSNENDKSVYLTNTRSADSSSMHIYKSVTNMGNGYYRDEVVFDTPDLSRISNNERQISRQISPYNEHIDNKFFACTGVDKDNKEVFENLEFIEKANGDYCRIWFLDNNSAVDSSLFSQKEFKRLAEVVDTVFTREKQIFGNNTFCNDETMIAAGSNTKLDVLIYDLYGDAEKCKKENHGTFGFFNQNDFFLAPWYSKSNECQVIHIDSYFWQTDIEGSPNPQNHNEIEQTHKIESTIVHELQHLLNYCQTYKPKSTDTWFNEMLSMCAEDIFQSIIGTSDDDSPKSRFELCFDCPYKGFKNWPSQDSPVILNFYANAYAFGAYLMRNYGGIELINLIATNNYSNEEAITHALATLGYDEDFNSVIQKFGMIYIMKGSNGKSLNKTLTETFKGTQYTLGAIDLNKYFFQVYETERAAKSAIRNYIYYPQTYSNVTDAKGNILYALSGPVIYKENYILTEKIQKYGFIVYYVDKINSSKTYNFTKPADGITMSVVAAN